MRSWLILALPLALLAACANDQEGHAKRDRTLGGVAPPKEDRDELTEKEVERYLKAMQQIRDLDLQDDRFGEKTLHELATAASNFKLGGDALDVMREHGLEEPRLADVRERVLLAWGAVRFESEREELLKLRQRDLDALEKLKQRGLMDAAQYQEMRAKAESSVRDVEKLFAAVPDDERELVRERREEFIALFG